ncbi:MAG: CHAT domain-containing protein [Phycisphaerae bacterium]
MRAFVTVTFAVLQLGLFLRVACAQEYPEASLDQATVETIESLKIERYAGLDEEAVQGEYQWALDMAALCLENPRAVAGHDGSTFWAAGVEFQRHAGRTARYRGFMEQALEDYAAALGYVYETVAVLREEENIPRLWTPEQAAGGLGEITILRDIADTYLMMGVYEPAAELSNLIENRQKARGKDPVSTSSELGRLAVVAQRQGRFGESVGLQQRAVRIVESELIPGYLDRHADLPHIDPNRPWAETVRHQDVRRVMDDPGYDDYGHPTSLREIYYRLARVLRLNGQFDEAAYALETAELTPWRMAGSYRQNLDYYVDREWAFLALDRGEAREAVRRGNECLSKYVDSMSPGERVELLDLVSRALERQGDLQGAFDRLKEAIAIVEGRRANLFEDENKQLYLAQYADLYRRACELVIKIGQRQNSEWRIQNSEGRVRRADHDGGAPGSLSKVRTADPTTSKVRTADPTSVGPRKDSRPSGYDRGTTEKSFEWAERAKARAMLDTMRRLGRRMAGASKAGDTKEIGRTRELAGEVVSIRRLQQATWWNDHAALIEYMLTPRGAWVWVVTRHAADLRRIEAAPDRIEHHARALKEALLPGAPRDDSWEAPAAWLYDALIRPIEPQIERASHLVIIGDGLLREIPFETFVDRASDPTKRLLIHRKTVSYAPSCTVLQDISRTRDRQDWNYDYWGFASTRFHSPESRADGVQPDDPVGMVLRSVRGLELAPLPNAGREVTRVAEMFPPERRRIFIDYHEGDRTAKDVLLSASGSGELAGVRHLHFATHASLDSNRPFDSGLVLSPPYVDQLEKVSVAEDGWPFVLLPQSHSASGGGGANSSEGDTFAPGEIAPPRSKGLSIHAVAPPLVGGAPSSCATHKGWRYIGDRHRRLNRQTPENVGQPVPAEIRPPLPARREWGTRFRWDLRARRASILSLHEIGDLKLGCDLVMLSSCQALGASPVDGDWLIGLTRAFLVAGSDAVICTLWDVADSSAGQITTTTFYAMGRSPLPMTGWKACPTADALRAAKLALLRSPVWKHPSHWAGFVCHGGVADR